MAPVLLRRTDCSNEAESVEFKFANGATGTAKVANKGDGMSHKMNNNVMIGGAWKEWKATLSKPVAPGDAYTIMVDGKKLTQDGSCADGQGNFKAAFDKKVYLQYDANSKKCENTCALWCKAGPPKTYRWRADHENVSHSRRSVSARFLGSLALSFGYVVEPSPRRADRFERRVSNSPRRRTQLTLIGVGFVAPRSYVDCSGTALKVGFVFQDKPGTVGWRAGATDPKFWWHFQFGGKDQHIIYAKKKAGTNEWVVDPGFPLHLGQQHWAYSRWNTCTLNDTNK